MFRGDSALHTVNQHLIGLHRIRNIAKSYCAFSHIDLMMCEIYVQALHELEACNAVRECVNCFEVKCMVGAFSLKP